MHVRRLSFVLALAAAALPAVPRAQAPGARPSGAALLGIESANGDSGIALRLDGIFPQRSLAPKIGLAIVGSVGYTRVSNDQTYLFFNERWKSTLDLFRIAPAVRFTFGDSPSLRPYADAGLGIYFASTHLDMYDYPSGALIARDSRSDTGLFLRLAGGILVQVSPAISLGAEVGLNPASGNLDNTFHAMAALQARL